MCEATVKAVAGEACAKLPPVSILKMFLCFLQAASRCWCTSALALLRTQLSSPSMRRCEEWRLAVFVHLHMSTVRCVLQEQGCAGISSVVPLDKPNNLPVRATGQSQSSISTQPCLLCRPPKNISLLSVSALSMRRAW
jgi:hypothetical protein